MVNIDISNIQTIVRVLVDDHRTQSGNRVFEFLVLLRLPLRRVFPIGQHPLLGVPVNLFTASTTPDMDVVEELPPERVQ